MPCKVQRVDGCFAGTGARELHSASPEDTAEGVLVWYSEHHHAATIVSVKVNAFRHLQVAHSRSPLLSR